MTTPNSADPIGWLNSAQLAGQPLPVLLLAPGRAFVNAPTGLLIDPPADLEVVLPRARGFVTRPVLSVTLVADLPDPDTDEERVGATLAFEPADCFPATDVLEGLLVAYATAPPTETISVGEIRPPEFLARLAPPPFGRGVPVSDLRQRGSASWNWTCIFVPKNCV